MPAAHAIARKKSSGPPKRESGPAVDSRPAEAFMLNSNPGACACGGGCPRCEAKARSAAPASLRMGPTNDAAEQEADNMAAQMIRTMHAASPGDPGPNSKANPRISPHSAVPAAGNSNAPPIVQEVLQSPGQALSAEARSMMEPHFGRSFADVQVHANTQAADSAEAVNARAYAVGRHLVFGSGQYAPGTFAGRHLLAHELTHVVQQFGHCGRVLRRQPKSATSPDPKQIDPKNLSTLGPDFHKPEAEVRKISGLKEMRLTDSTDDPDFALFWLQNSTVRLQNLRAGTVFKAPFPSRGDKVSVWAFTEGETDMSLGYVKSSLLEDLQVARWLDRQKPLFSLTPPNLSPPSVSTKAPSPKSYQDSWDAVLNPPLTPQPTVRNPMPWLETKVDDTTVWNYIGHALHEHNGSALKALEDIESQRDAFPYDPNLAAADHYLFARLLVELGFPRISVAAGTEFYGMAKKLGIVPSFKIDTFPTPDTPAQRKWGVWGAYDDYMAPTDVISGALPPHETKLGK